jgi:large subunit ribosomal protein L30
MATKKAAGGMVKLKRVGSPIRREHTQRETLIGLGLTRANKVVELKDTPSVRGMMRKVGHLIEVVSE